MRTINQMMDVARREMTPEQVRLYYPRRYLTPDGDNYWSPFGYSFCSMLVDRYIDEHVNRVLAAHTYVEKAAIGHPYSNPVHQTCHRVVNAGKRFGFPTYFVGEMYARSLMATHPPEDMTLNDVQWPMDWMLLVLPVRMMQEFTGGWLIPWIALYHSPIGEASKDFDSLLMHFPVILQNGMPLDYSSWMPCTVSVGEMLKPVDYFITPQFEEGLRLAMKSDVFGECPIPQGEADLKIQEVVVGLTASILLAYSAEPEFVEGSECARKERFRHGKLEKEALWHPHWIGRNFHPHHERAGGDGTHASPRMHWRIGHWRWQPFGKGRAQRRLIRIKPVLVNPDPGYEGQP